MHSWVTRGRQLKSRWSGWGAEGVAGGLAPTGQRSRENYQPNRGAGMRRGAWPRATPCASIVLHRARWLLPPVYARRFYPLRRQNAAFTRISHSVKQHASRCSPELLPLNRRTHLCNPPAAGNRDGGAGRASPSWEALPASFFCVLRLHKPIRERYGIKRCHSFV